MPYAYYITCGKIISYFLPINMYGADAGAIVGINKRRWEMEECFRIMKSEFKARPV
jgi:hypothetical protein